jgi:hypothetical protein
MRLKENKNKVTGNWEIIFSTIKFFAKHILDHYCLYNKSMPCFVKAF